MESDPIEGGKSDFGTGLFFLAIGLFTAFLAAGYETGEMARMGPGYLPLVLGFILAGLGLVLLASAWRSSGRVGGVPHIQFRPVLLVLAGPVLFAVSVEYVGMVIATILLVGIVSLADRDNRWKRTAFLAAFLAALAVLVFIRGIGLYLPVWPPL